MKGICSIAELFRIAYRKVVPTTGRDGKQKEIVFDSGVPQSTISSIIAGRREGTEEQRRAIAKALGFEYEDFLDLGRLEIGMPSLKKVDADGENSFSPEQNHAIDAFKLVVVNNDPAARMIVNNVLDYAKTKEAGAEFENPTSAKLDESA